MSSGEFSRVIAIFGFTIALLPAAFAISCYDCNSRTDPRCADPFDNYSIAIVDCSQKIMPHLNKTADRCRKITQKVDGEVRVHRSCGWLEDRPSTSCYLRAGTYHILMEYCVCKDGDGCNSAMHAFSAFSTGSALVIAFLVSLTPLWLRSTPSSLPQLRP